MDAMRIKPSRKYYLLAAALLLVSLAMIAIWAVLLVRMVGDLPQTQIIVPGSGEFEITEPGDYVVFYEERSVVNGKAFYGPPAVPAMSCQISQLPEGQDIPLRPVDFSYRYTCGSRVGETVWQFHAPVTGLYELSAQYTDVESGMPETTLAVGSGFPWRSFVLLLVLGLVGGLFGIAALATFLVTLIRRIQAKSRLARAGAVPPVQSVV